MKHGLARLLLATALTAFCASPFAVFDPVNDDTDLFRNNPNSAGERPNVLIILDNTANWSSGSKFNAEKNALSTVVNSLDGSFNVGLMIMGQGGNCRTVNIDGAYVRYGIRQMTPDNKAALVSLIGREPISPATTPAATGFLDAPCATLPGGDQGSSATGGQAMHEAYLYYAGKVSRSGITQVKRDYGGSIPAGDPAPNKYNPFATNRPDNPLADASATQYVSPIINGCEKNYIIFLSNGPFDNGDDNPSSQLFAGTGGLRPGQTPFSAGASSSNWIDEYADYLANEGVIVGGHKRNVFTYTMEVNPVTSGTQGPGLTNLLKSAASHGQGKYFGVNATETGSAIADALNSIFQEIQAVNSVFAASTLPVSVNVRGTNLNQLYIGVFRPDASDRPRWLGNLKAYQLKKDSLGNVFTVDAGDPDRANPPGTAPIPAIDSTNTGFIVANARSFWTDKTLLPNYWSFRPASQNGVGGSSDSPDGDLVEKGGAGLVLRHKYFAGGVNGSSLDLTLPVRPLYTCTQGTNFPVCAPGSLLSATPFRVDDLVADPGGIDNKDIGAGPLNIASRIVTSLTAAVVKPVSAVTDVRALTLNNAGLTQAQVDLVVTNTAFACFFTLNNTRSVTISTISNGAVTRTASFSKQGTKNRGTLASHGLAIGQTIIVTGTTSFNTAGTSITATGTSTFDYGSFAGSGNPTESGSLITSNSVVLVNAPNHGFNTNDYVTIAGVTPAEFNGLKQITKLDANNFSYVHTVSVAPTQAVVGVNMTASAASSIVTATGGAACTAPVPSAGQVIAVRRADATFDSYTGAAATTYTVLSNPAPTANTFAFQTPTAIATPTAYANYETTQSGTTATGFALDPLNVLGWVDGGTLSLNISGASPAGFNGQFTVTNIRNLSLAGSDGDDPAVGCHCDCNSCPGYWRFKYTVPVGLGYTAAQADPAVTIKASADTSAVVTATLANHGFATGDTVTIAGVTGAAAASWNQSWSPITKVDNATFTFNSGGSLASPAGNPTVRLTSNPRGYATITGHGYGAAGTSLDPITVAGAGGYNGSYTGSSAGRVEDADTVSFGMTAAPGPVAVTAATATTNGTTAVATSASHGFSPGTNNISISGASPSATFGGTRSVISVTQDTFTYTIGSPAGAASGLITAISTGGTTDNERVQVVNWIRGTDNIEDENHNSSIADTRASIHGDVLHSRPAVVNYNRFFQSDPPNADNDVFIFYGGNDGVFRALKGGFASTSGQPSPGSEVWGFVAPEHFGDLKRLRLNSPAISSTYKKPYFFDGPIGTYTLDRNGDGKILTDPDPTKSDIVWLFLAPRRGGRFIYALDVSDPIAPKLLWRRGCPALALPAGPGGCDMGWDELGYAFSEPKVIALNSAITSDPALIFGAGYDKRIEDLDPTTVTASSAASVTAAGTTYNRDRASGAMGRGLFVVNARTGAIIWRASGEALDSGDTGAGFYLNVPGMDYSIASDIAVVLGDPTPKPFRAYVGDTGGNMWRVDFGDANTTNWTVTNLAAIGDQATAAGRRKFLFPPDVIGDVGFDMVVAGTGDREHPFDTSVVNRVYAFKDRSQTDSAAAASASTITHSDTFTFHSSAIKSLLDVSNNCIQVAANCGANGMGAPEVAVTTPSTLTASQNDAAALADNANEGWFITLASGEKQVGGTLASGSGAVVFGTNQPNLAATAGGACSPNLGVARQYAVNFENGTAFTGTSLSKEYAGGGYLPSPVLVYVGLGGTAGTGTSTSGVPVGGNVAGGQLQIGAGSSMGGGNDPTGVVCYGAACMLAPGKQLYSRLRKFWYKEID